jgi:hypothetical protein
MGNYRFVRQSELDFIRKVQGDNLFDTCVVDRPTQTSTGYGGWTTTYTTIGEYNCRFWISSGPSGTSQESHFWGGQELGNTVGFITLPWNADIKLKDRITYTHSESGEVRKFQVTGLQKKDTFVTATRVRVEGLRDENG